MTSKIVVNNIEADSGINTVTFNSNISGNLIGNVTGNVNSTGVTTVTSLRIGTGTSISSPATNVLTLGTNNSERVRIDSSGNTGIGTILPAGKIHVTTTGSRAALFGPGSSFTNLYSSYLDGQSNVGLEITSNAPSAQGGATLVLSNSQTDSGCSIGGISFTTSGTSGSEKRGALINSQLEGSGATNVTANLLFYTTNSGSIVERARFNSTGAFVLAGGTTTANGIGIAFPFAGLS